MRSVIVGFILWLCSLILSFPVRAGIFGEELIPLAKLVAGQVVELERLAEAVGVAKDQREMLKQINEGIESTTYQIQALELIVERTQGLDPSSVRSVSQMTDLIYQIRGIHEQASEIVAMKIRLADQAIAQSALQSQTAYTMGQEMTQVGTVLAIESKTASPGRAGQISAAAASSQMLASGVQLQTLAQIAQLQAMTLEFQKSQVERELSADQWRRNYLLQQLKGGSGARKGVRP